MKKLVSIFLVAALFAVAVLGCGCDGIRQATCKHEFSGDYLDVFCHKGCGASKRPTSLRTYDDKFVYDFDSTKQAALDKAYDDVIAALERAEPYDETKHAFDKDSDYYKANKDFEHNYYDKFSEQLEYVTEQYQYAYVFYCKYDGEEGTEQAYKTVSEARTKAVSDYYTLFRKVYDTQYRNYFFSEEDGWTTDEIQVALNMSDSYGSAEYVELNNQIDELQTTYRSFSESELTGNKMDNLYKNYVVLQNRLAALSTGDYNNYVDYAYRNVYERDYTPDDVRQMRSYVKNSIVPLFNKVMRDYITANGDTYVKVGSYGKNYTALCEDSIFDNDLTLDYVGKYFAKVTSSTVGAQNINYYVAANELFKNGNYYTGDYEGAFSYYIPAQNATILYFGPDSYSSAFTFVHEFGHYYNNIYNPGISLSMDHDETQSQGDEMLFLVYLQDYLAETNQSRLAKVVRNEQLFNMLATVLMSTAVDEFEQKVYALADDLTVLSNANLQKLFEDIMSDYGIEGLFDSNYWRRVVVDSPCYYISYAMSALPAMGIYATAQKDGFNKALDCYLKLYTFSDQADLAHTDAQGDKVVDATYAEILHFAGLYGAFDQQLYTLLTNWL